MAALLVDVGNGKPLRVELVGERLTVGRRQGSDLRLPHPSVSAKHAVLVRAGDGWVLEDLGSRNGTVVNGRRAPRRRLRDGDVVEIGVHRIVFAGDEAERAKASAAGRPAMIERRARGSAGARAGDKAAAGAGVTAVASESRTPSAAPAAPAVSPRPFVPSLPAALLRTRSGGRDAGEVRLAKMLTALGHEGVVAGWVAVRDGGFFAVPAADAALPLRVDGAAIDGSFRRLHGGEVLSVGDAELEFVVVG